MSRHDGRTPLELRSLALSQSVLSRQDGSAKFSFGNLSVLASVTGPAEVRIRNELVDRAAFEINVLPLRGAVGTQTSFVSVRHEPTEPTSTTGPPSKSQETLLLSLLTPIILLSLHPRSLIQLTIQTLTSPTTAFSKQFSTDLSSTDLAASTSSSAPRGTGTGASEKAAMINAAMLALVDAAVECRGLVLAAAVAFVESEGEEVMVLDPTPREEDEASSTHLFAFSFGVGVGGVEGDCVGVDSVGSFSPESLFEAQDLAAEASRGIMAFVRRSIESRYGATPTAPKVEKVKAPDEMQVE
ncbi:exosome complex component RRP46, partial [Phenoliferia sp. Uapishka_3]